MPKKAKNRDATTDQTQKTKSQKEQREIDEHVGRNVRAARIASGLSAADVAKKLDIALTTLSAMENGKRSFKAYHLAILGQLFAEPLDQLLGNSAPIVEFQDPKKAVLEPLESIYGLGFERGFPDRSSALLYIVPYIRSLRSCEIDIVCSSALGLKRQADEFYRAVRDIQEGDHEVTIRVLMTHPNYGHVREKIEGRREHDIVHEIVEGAIWFLTDMHFNEDQIRFLHGPPTIFCVLLPGYSILNIYPLTRQAYESWAILVRNRDSGDRSMDPFGGGVSRTLNQKNFSEVFASDEKSCSLKNMLSNAESESWYAECEQEIKTLHDILYG